MNTFLKCTSALAIAMVFAAAHGSPPTVNPEQMDLDPDITAKILKEKSKRVTTPAAGGGDSASKDCGSVNIASNEKKSNSGIGQMLSKPTTVIVTGDVINMAKCK